MTASPAGTDEQQRRVVILGGGLTGISAAMHLNSPWVLLEKEARLGGHARTDERDGHKSDKSGHWLHLRDPEVKKLVGELLPGEMVEVARRTRIFSLAILIDRYGYEDRGEPLLTQIAGPAPRTAVLAESERYVAIDLRAVPKSPAPQKVEELFSRPLTSSVPPCGRDPVFHLDLIGTTRGPFTQSPVSVSASRDFSVSGWAIDDAHHSTAAHVDVIVGREIFPASYGLGRSAVAAYFKVPAYLASGFTAKVRAQQLATGSYTLSIRVLSNDRKCYYQSPAARNVTIVLR